MSYGRTCMFCGQRASSKEHAWPQWLLELLATPEGAEIEAQRGNLPTVRWQSLRPELTAKCVCQQCNHGWMSRLEQSTKPIVEALLTGTPISLEKLSQATLSRWALKTSMVFEALRHGRDWFYTEQERSDVMTVTRLPERTCIWLAPVVHSPGAFCTGTDVGESAERLSTEASGYVTTLAVGSVALQVFTLRVPSHIPASTSITAGVRPGRWSESTVAIYPSHAAVMWPTAAALNGEAGITALASRWRPIGVPE